MKRIDVKFMGWDRPPLAAASEWLTSGPPSLRERAGGRVRSSPNAPALAELDLSDVSIITPGGRVGRLLLGMLIDRAAAMKVPLSPPNFLTPGEIPALILGPLGTLAGPIHRRIAWARAIQKCEARARLLPHPPESDDVRSWHAIASMLEKCHAELIGDGLRFGDVPSEVPSLDDTEAARWRAADAVQRVYQAELASVGLIDEGLATVDALARSTPPAIAQRIILVGVSELSRNARRALSLPGIEVTSLVFAPESLSSTFDECGCVIPDEWKARTVPLDDQRLIVADTPRDQAERAMEVIAKLDGRYPVHEIVIGVPDDEVVAPLQHAAERYAGVAARPASGAPISSTPIYQLLRGVARIAEDGSFDAFAALARHPDVERYLLRALGTGRLERWLDAMDTYAVKHLPGGGTWFDATILADEREGLAELEAVRKALRRLLGPLAGSGASLADVPRMLERLYRGRLVNRDDPATRAAIDAAAKVKEAITQAASLPRGWMSDSSALRTLLDVLSTQRLPQDGSPDAIELLGWLEVPLDPSPVAIITGVNDGRLPESYGADPLLPDGLRAKLGINCSSTRLSRDTYLMSLILHSRPEVTLISGRRGRDGDPLLPSRLLFAADPDAVVHRIGRFVRPHTAARTTIASRLSPGGVNRFPIMPRRALEPINSMRVTGFRAFLKSPYQFYLEQVLCLKEKETQPPEMDPLVFGNFLHTVLERFGNSDARDADSAAKIRECVLDHLSTLSHEVFGASPPAAVSIQIEIARLRLEEFATWQESHRRAGWRIDRIEWKPTGGRALLPGMSPEFFLRGKIDRIDLNESGAAAIIDYKTSERADPPKVTHGKPGKWKDLQLPLYRHLVAELNLPPDQLTLAYVTLPKTPGGVQLLAGTWTPEDLADADTAARDVASRVARGEFFDLGDDPPDEGTLAALCGTAFFASTRGMEGAE